nr:hypothetical protein [uncultured Mediterranean phage uvMED]
MTKSIQRVLQADGTYRWKSVEHVSEAEQIKQKEACVMPKSTKKARTTKVVKQTDTETKSS